MVRVVFTHDDDCLKWEAVVEGTDNPVEARQAFAAVVLTCRMLEPRILDRTKVKQVDSGKFEITPAVIT